MNEVLITGGLGFIGSHLARECINLGKGVTIISRSTKKLKNISGLEDRVNLLVKDVRDISESDVKNKKFLFHLAGSVDNYSIIEGTPYKDIDLNCTNTIAVLEAIRRFSPQTRLIFGSTFFVNGNLGIENLPATPISPCAPLGLYPATRLAGENFCKIYSNVFDLDFVTARFTNVFGPHEQGDNAKKAGFNFMIKKALEEKRINLYNNGEFFRDYIYVTDVADACLTLAEKGEKGGTYYVGRGGFTKFKELINVLGREIPYLEVSSVNPPNFHNRVGITDFACDTSPIRNLGWQPRVSLEEGIKRTVEYYKSIKETL